MKCNKCEETAVVYGAYAIHNSVEDLTPLCEGHRLTQDYQLCLKCHGHVDGCESLSCPQCGCAGSGENKALFKLTVELTWDAESGQWTSTLKEYPAVVSQGPTAEEAARRALRCLRDFAAELG